MAVDAMFINECYACIFNNLAAHTHTRTYTHNLCEDGLEHRNPFCRFVTLCKPMTRGPRAHRHRVVLPMGTHTPTLEMLVQLGYHIKVPRVDAAFEAVL